MIGFVAGFAVGSALVAGYFHFKVKALRAVNAQLVKGRLELAETFSKLTKELKQSYVTALEAVVMKPEAELKAEVAALLAKAKSILH